MNKLENALQTSRNSKSAPNVVVIARAGTGKTTTIIEGLTAMRGGSPRITPSDQQSDIWEEMSESRNANTICLAAFNKSIATELQMKVPNGVDAATMHSLGYRAVSKRFGKLRCDGNRSMFLAADYLGQSIRDLRRENYPLLSAVERLVGLCKLSLVFSPDDETILDLASYYDIEIDGIEEEVCRLVPIVLERSKEVEGGLIDYNDMIWLPIALNLPVFKYDLLMVDEAQDLNPCQQELSTRLGKRIIYVGDDKQAIYGFAGADTKSLRNLVERFPGCVELPLTVTRRCGKEIVKEAQRIVPDFTAHESNTDGRVLSAKMEDSPKEDYLGQAMPGDMVLCRTNAPLVHECFRAIRDGRKANINGRDIGLGLISTIKKMEASSVSDLELKLDAHFSALRDKELNRAIPRDQKLVQIDDRQQCLEHFTEGADSVTHVMEKITNVFSDGRKSSDILLFSSIHKSKGLEAESVTIIQPKGATVPHPMAKTVWQKEQEMNLKYVAITRAISQLTFAHGPELKRK